MTTKPDAVKVKADEVLSDLEWLASLVRQFEAAPSISRHLKATDLEWVRAKVGEAIQHLRGE
jgi:hypothetical protein